jgi:hypothetical protein
LHSREEVRDLGLRLGRVVDANRNQERAASRYELCALIGKMPFEPEISLSARLCVPRDNRNEESTATNLPTNLLIPRIAGLRLTLVEPDFYASRSQGFANSARGFSVFGGVAEKDGAMAVN